MLGNIRSAEDELIIQKLELNLDQDLAKSKAKIIANDINPSLATSLVFANGTSIIDSAFQADTSLPEIPKVLTKSLLDVMATGSFLQSQYLASLQWQIFSQFASFIAQDQSQKMYDALKEFSSDIAVGKTNRKQGGEYQLPTIEFSAGFINVLIPSLKNGGRRI